MRIDWDELLPPKSSEKVGVTEGNSRGADSTAEHEQEHVEPATDAGIAAREREGDNRRRCTECGNLGARGICLAAQRGQIVASRNYVPVQDIMRRCEGFAPMPTDPDQTPGRVKYAWLTEVSRPKDALL